MTEDVLLDCPMEHIPESYVEPRNHASVGTLILGDCPFWTYQL